MARLTASRKGSSSGQPEARAVMKGQEPPDPRPKKYFDKFHRRARTKKPEHFVYGTIHLLMFILGVPAFRIEIVGQENVPASGGVLLAPNHNSFFDHFLVAVFLRRIVRFMAKSQMFKWPWYLIYNHGGCFPIRRKLQDEESMITARTILEQGGAVLMYCQGGRSRSGEISPKEARPGIGRLALETGVPVVPVAIHGSDRLRYWKEPRRMGWPKITIVCGEPTQYDPVAASSRQQQQRVADRVLGEIRSLHENVDRPGHWITGWFREGLGILVFKASHTPS